MAFRFFVVVLLSGINLQAQPYKYLSSDETDENFRDITVFNKDGTSYEAEITIREGVMFQSKIEIFIPNQKRQKFTANDIDGYSYGDYYFKSVLITINGNEKRRFVHAHKQGVINLLYYYTYVVDRDMEDINTIMGSPNYRVPREPYWVKDEYIQRDNGHAIAVGKSMNTRLSLEQFRLMYVSDCLDLSKKLRDMEDNKGFNWGRYIAYYNNLCAKGNASAKFDFNNIFVDSLFTNFRSPNFMPALVINKDGSANDLFMKMNSYQDLNDGKRLVVFNSDYSSGFIDGSNISSYKVNGCNFVRKFFSKGMEGKEVFVLEKEKGAITAYENYWVNESYNSRKLIENDNGTISPLKWKKLKVQLSEYSKLKTGFDSKLYKKQNWLEVIRIYNDWKRMSSSN